MTTRMHGLPNWHPSHCPIRCLPSHLEQQLLPPAGPARAHSAGAAPVAAARGAARRPPGPIAAAATAAGRHLAVAQADLDGLEDAPAGRDCKSHSGCLCQTQVRMVFQAPSRVRRRLGR